MTIENPTESFSIIKNKHYTEYYDDNTIKKVSKLAEKDISKFNYD